MASWTSADLSKAAATPHPEAALAFVNQRIGTKKDPFEQWVFELLLHLAK